MKNKKPLNQAASKYLGSKATSTKSTGKKTLKGMEQSLPQKLTSRITSIESGTWMRAGAAVLGAAAVAALGFYAWKKRDSIMGFAEKVGDEFTTRFGHEETTSSIGEYPYKSSRDEDYYSDSTRHM